MSGLESIKISRKKFLFAIVAVLLVTLSNWFYKYKSRIKNIFGVKIAGSQQGANVAAGHLIHQKFDTSHVSDILKYDYVIVGAGVSGLTAARELEQKGIKNILILELETQIGGNSQAQNSNTTKAPWGAHYLPIPNNDDVDLINFLRKHEIITAFDAHNKPIYNEFYICHEPEERLFINGKWQEGLIPTFGITAKFHEDFERFHKLMEKYKFAKGNDGKFAFTIPLELSSRDSQFLELDKITFSEFLEQHHLKNPFLDGYINYCCKDDYGIHFQNTSAWAGIHYFASRRSLAANVESSAVLTWPEGNNFLVKCLQSELKHTHICTNSLVRQIELDSSDVKIFFSDLTKQKHIQVSANKCIVAAPQFIRKKLLPNYFKNQETHGYSPWLVANITLHKNTLDARLPLAWDNVLFNSESVGYVWAGNQSLQSKINETIITFYRPLSADASTADRIKAFKMNYEQQVELVINELSKAHPNISRHVKKIDTWIWGHGMIAPQKSYIWDKRLKDYPKTIQEKIFFAHSDMSGISIFEEAFYQGTKAARTALAYENK